MIRIAFIICASILGLFLSYSVGFRNGWKSYERIRGRSIGKLGAK
jgi:hypothetical protein